MIMKQNKRIFNDIKMMSLKNILILFSLFLVAFFIMALILTLSQNGFNNANEIFIVNKYLIITIPIASSSLAISSLILQQLSKNKLADNSLLGMGNVNLLSLMLLISIVDFNSDYSVNNYLNIYPFIFIITSILTSLFIYSISYKKNKNISKKFILVGIILNFTFISLTVSLDSFLPPGKSAAVRQFINGFIDSSNEMSFYVALSGFVLGNIWLFFIYSKLRICSSDFFIAKSLGINSSNIYLQALLISGLLSSVAYILVGNISFLGLLASNIAYSIYKKKYNYTFPASCLIATIIIGLVYLINKNILNSNINSAGLIPIMGIPYFIYLIIKEK